MTLARSEPTAIQTDDGSAEAFEQLVDLVCQQRAASTARIYRQTYALWHDWSVDNGVSVLDLRPAHVIAFLAAQDVVKGTRQRQLSALRQLAQMLYILTQTDASKRLYDALMMIKAPTVEGSGTERTRRALSPAEADKVLRVWDEPTNTHRRNQALIAVLALGALRRSEAAALRWRDIDFENGVITVRHGKGDKYREVPLAGDFALDALRAWQMCQHGRARICVLPDRARRSCRQRQADPGHGHLPHRQGNRDAKRRRLQAARSAADVHHRGAGDRHAVSDGAGGCRARTWRDDAQVCASCGCADGAEGAEAAVWMRATSARSMLS